MVEQSPKCCLARSGVCSVARVIGAALVLLCAADVLLAERQMQWGPVRVGIVRLDTLRVLAE